MKWWHCGIIQGPQSSWQCSTFPVKFPVLKPVLAVFMEHFGNLAPRAAKGILWLLKCLSSGSDFAEDPHFVLCFYWIRINFELSFKRVDFFSLYREFYAVSYFSRRQFCTPTVRLVVGHCQWEIILDPALALECWILLLVWHSLAVTAQLPRIPAQVIKFHGLLAFFTSRTVQMNNYWVLGVNFVEFMSLHSFGGLCTGTEPAQSWWWPRVWDWVCPLLVVWKIRVCADFYPLFP